MTRNPIADLLIGPARWLMLFGLVMLALCVLGFVHRPWWWGALLIVVPFVVVVYAFLIEDKVTNARACRWRENIALGDKCEFLNIGGTWTQGKVTRIPDDKRMILVEVNSLHSRSSGLHPITSLYPVKP